MLFVYSQCDADCFESLRPIQTQAVCCTSCSSTVNQLFEERVSTGATNFFQFCTSNIHICCKITKSSQITVNNKCNLFDSLGLSSWLADWGDYKSNHEMFFDQGRNHFRVDLGIISGLAIISWSGSFWGLYKPPNVFNLEPCVCICKPVGHKTTSTLQLL